MFFVYLTLIISFLLDGVLSNYLDYMLGDITLFNPLLTLVALLVIYPFFKKDENKYLDLLKEDDNYVNSFKTDIGIVYEYAF